LEAQFLYSIASPAAAVSGIVAIGMGKNSAVIASFPVERR
jgi:hypothetical protein